MRILRLNFIFFSLLALGASSCSIFPDNYVPAFVKPYKFDIHQGNFVTQQDVTRLQVGMNKDQVRFILGTPLLNDAFHADRWDYVYRLLKANGQSVQSRYTVEFDKGILIKHGGENLPQNPTDLQGPDFDAQAEDKIPSSETPAKDIQDSESIKGSDRAPIIQ